MACAALSGRQGRRGARRDAGTSGKRLDAPCRPDSAALRVAPRRPPASSRASTVVPATLFGPLLADRTPGRDAGRDPGEKCGLPPNIRADTGRDPFRRGPEGAARAPVRGGVRRQARGRGILPRRPRQYVAADIRGHPGGRLLHGIAREMGVARCGLHPGMAEQPGDRRQALAERQRAAGEGVAEVVQPDVVEPGQASRAAPLQEDAR